MKLIMISTVPQSSIFGTISQLQSMMRIHRFLVFFIFLCSISLAISSHGVTHSCHDHQHFLLLQLKSNLIFNSSISTKLIQWNQTRDCCQWNGECIEGCVSGLDLSEESIIGGIDDSSSLFSLHYLQSLNLAFNNFNATAIPSEIQKLTNLRYLNLSNAGFEGQIPIGISHLTSMVVLDLSTDYLWSSAELKLEKPDLLILVQNLTKITELYLDGVYISDPKNEWAHVLSSSLPNLQVLSLGNCGLSSPIHSSLSSLQSLSIIRLYPNDFSSSVPEFFAHLSNLTILELGGSGFRGIFPENIFLLERLELLDVSYNFDLKGSLLDFPQYSTLQTLILSNTTISGSLPNSIGNLRHLSTLDAYNCKFQGTLPSSMSNLSQLVELDLSENRFTGSIPSFSACKKLVEINLSHNNLIGEIPSTHFEGMLNLVDIDLQNNSLSGMIPSVLFSLPSVRRILLYSNQFEGKLEDVINASSEVADLSLSNNNLRGPIPASVFQLKKLVILRLSSNKFSGPVEFEKFRMLRNLSTLDLSYNNLSFTDIATLDSPFLALRFLSLVSCKLTIFPRFLKNQSSLTSLDLSNNLIGGTLPQWIWSFSSLNYLNLSHNFLTYWDASLQSNTSYLYELDLHSNYLQGSLSVLPQQATYLDYSNNNISFVIPQDIGNYLSVTSFLSLASNNIHGSIPESICNATNLEFLDLSNNSLAGSIPKCLIRTLSVLDIRSNKLSGNIESFPGPCNLITLDLNDNLLEGKLPEYLGNCSMLEVVDLGNNQIDDKFPCWLKSKTSLRVLILRSNKLHGSVECPTPTTEATWPHLQIIDLASNNFSGKIPLAFFRTWKAMMVDAKDKSHSEVNNLQVEILKFDQISYHDRVTVISKGMKMNLVKILTVFTSIDFSDNKFEGPIPEELGQLKALYILNLSNNAFSGHIPSSFGNMKDLESLDLSNNSLSGEIPTELASLSFLSFLNLSFNHLVGKIPTSTQIQSFEAGSFQGNEGLCGPPLTQNCSSDGVLSETPHSDDDAESSIDWNFLSVEMGFVFGFGLVILPLMFWNPWRLWYCKHVDNLLYRIFPQLDFVYESHAGKKYRNLRWKPC